MLKNILKKILKSALAVVLTAAIVISVLPYVKMETKADSMLSLNTDYDIEGLSQADAIAAIALAQVGYKGYELGAVEGWCGDLIYSCAAAAGIDSSIIPYTGDPTVMFTGISGTLVTEDFKPGDIVYYPYCGANGHVAIVVGDGIAVHGNSNNSDYLYSEVIVGDIFLYDGAVVIRPDYLDASTADMGYVVGDRYADYPDTFFFDRYAPEDDEEDEEDQEDEEDFNMEWNLEDGILTISGEGDMPDMTDGRQPWYTERENITEIRIGAGITGIGENAFLGCEELKTVITTGDVKYIGDGAFASCYSLNAWVFVGTEEERDEIEIGDYNYCLDDAEIGYHAFRDKDVKENITESTCAAQGGYDSVKYCSECGMELYRTYESLPVVAHKWEDSKVVKEPTDTENGLVEVYCSVCNGVKEVSTPTNRVEGIDEDFEGLIDYSFEGQGWYYFSNGRVDTTYNGFAENKYGMWYVSNGKADFDYTGLVLRFPAL